MPRAAALTALLAVPACVSPPDEEAGTSVQAQLAGDQCDEDDCGNGNSPVINGVYFWMLHSKGEANPQGVAIKEVRRADGVPMQLVAVIDQLIGKDPVSGAVLAVGTGLINTRITVSVGGDRYQIRIADVTPTWDNSERFWVGNQGRIEAYTFNYRPLESKGIVDATGAPLEYPLCSLANQDPANPMIKAIAFTGDVYDPATKQITTGLAAHNWMNIACQHGAPYKMHAFGHTDPAQARLGIATSLDKRKALLNALTMNACGTGQAFTVQGTPIRLTESQNLLPLTSPWLPITFPIEAIWSDEGAVCLDTHRLGIPKEKIESACGKPLPSCDSMLAAWTGVGDVLTSVP